MYTPAAYALGDVTRLHTYMRRWNFATLVTMGESGFQATHLPFLIDESTGQFGTLITHLAAANPQLADLQAGVEALVIFQGPHAFISPSWYDNQLTFPTWNYVAIHARGKPTVINDGAAVHAVLSRMVAFYDQPLGGGWTFEGMPAERVIPRLSAIVALEIPLERLDGKLKINQDKSPADQRGVIAALEQLGEPGGLAMAELMRAELAHHIL